MLNIKILFKKVSKGHVQYMALVQGKTCSFSIEKESNCFFDVEVIKNGFCTKVSTPFVCDLAQMWQLQYGSSIDVPVDTTIIAKEAN